MSHGGYDLVPRQTLAILLWWLIGLFALVVPSAPLRPAWSGVAVTVFAVGIGLWVAVGIGHSASQERSVNELGRAVAHVAPIVLIGWVLPARAWRAVLGGLFAGAAFVLLAAFGNRLAPGFLGQTTATVFDSTASRLAAPLGYWNAMGSWGVMTAMLALGGSAHVRRSWQRSLCLSVTPLAITVVYLTYSRSSLIAAAAGAAVLLAFAANRWTLWLHTIGAAVSSLGVIVVIRHFPAIANATGDAGAASVLVSLIVAMAAVSVLPLLTERIASDTLAAPAAFARVAVAALSTVAVIAGTVVVSQHGDSLWNRFTVVERSDQSDPTARLTSLNNGARVEQWRVALDSWADHKVSGTGAGTFELTYNLRGPDGQFVRDAHSAYFEALSEQGIVGFGLLVGLTLAALSAAFKALSHHQQMRSRGTLAGVGAAVAAFFVGTAFDWFWEVTALAMYAMALVGVLIAAGKEQVPAVGSDGQAEKELNEPVIPSRRYLRAAVVLTAVVAVITELPALVGTSEVRRSQESATAGDLTSARAHADQAIETMPWASSPFLQRALVDERAAEWSSAERAMTLAMRRDPLDWRLPLVLARIQAEAGRPALAVEAYRDAKRLRPHGEFFR
jgi:hypothetical protein